MAILHFRLVGVFFFLTFFISVLRPFAKRKDKFPFTLAVGSTPDIFGKFIEINFYKVSYGLILFVV